MFAAAFWSLREAGALTLEVASKKRLGLITTRRLQYRLTDETARPGLEGAIVETAHRGEDEQVGDLVRRWFGKDVPDPHRDVVAVEIEAAIAAGLIHRTESDAGRGKVMGVLLGKTKAELSPDCAAIGALTDDAEQVRARWEAFGQAGAELRELLVERCANAISSRTESDDDWD